MPLLDQRSLSTLTAGFRALQALQPGAKVNPDATERGRILTGLMHHGGLYTLMNSDMMTARLTPMFAQAGQSMSAAEDFVGSLGTAIASFFQHLQRTSFYVLDSSLISLLSFPGLNAAGNAVLGVTYTTDQVPPQPAGLESTTIPAAFTFIGQFIDHDLTMNAVDLFTDQTGSTAAP